jgi:hypothetical protein
MRPRRLGREVQIAALFAILALLGAIALSGCKPSSEGPTSPISGRGAGGTQVAQGGGAGDAGAPGGPGMAGGGGGGMRGGGGGGMGGGGMGGGMRGGGGGGMRGGGMGGGGMRGGGGGGGGMRGGGMGGGGMGGAGMGGAGDESAGAEVVAPPPPVISEQEVRAFVNEATVQANVKVSGKVRNELEASLASPPTSDLLAAALKVKDARPELVGVLAKAMKDQGSKLQTEDEEKSVALAIWLEDALTGRLVEITSAGAPGLAAISDIEKLKLIQQFAALYGPVVWVKETNWDGRVIDWVTFTHKSQSVKLPVSMIVDASTIPKKPWLRLLEGYFGIYSTGLGFDKVASKQTVTASPELKAKVVAEQDKLAEEMNKPVVAAAAAEGEEGAGGMGGMGGGMGGGMRGGGMRGGGGGGMRGGGGGGGMRGGGGGGMRGGG